MKQLTSGKLFVLEGIDGTGKSTQAELLTEALNQALFLADRKEHVSNFIKPTLEAGTNVILDRYYFSTMAYQGARGIPPLEIQQQNEAFAPKPDLLFLVDIPVDLALERIGVRDGSGDAFETRESLARCQKIFHNITNEHFVETIDAQRSIGDIHAEILSLALKLLKENKS